MNGKGFLPDFRQSFFEWRLAVTNLEESEIKKAKAVKKVL
jgi:hypothetical protein